MMGRAMIALTILVIGLAGFLIIGAPGTMGGGMMDYSPRIGPFPDGVLVVLISVVGLVIGLVWMIRIHRADPEPDQHAWRYRAHDR